MRRVLVLLLALSTAACASTGAVPRPFPTTGSTKPARVAGPGVDSGTLPAETTLPAEGYALTTTALALRGIPYRNGGADPSGFDCSGFVRYVFAQHGVSMPRTVAELYHAGSAAALPLEAGDLVFFSTAGPGPTHVGIAIGGEEFVHAPSSSGVVRVERVSASYWASRFVGIRRIL